MCRLFAITAGNERVKVTHWLLDAPDSVIEQSHFEPDGTGLGFFDERGSPVLDRRPVAAFRDESFIQEARTESSSTFVAHIRFASIGSLEASNTHPFEQAGRLFAHNGILYEVENLEREVGEDYLRLVDGETDSERLFALITKRIDELGDVTEGIAAAVRWVADNLPVYSLNLALCAENEMWVLRYPDTHELFVLERGLDNPGPRHFRGASANGALRVHSDEIADKPTVLVASEPLDDHPDWRVLPTGSLLHVAPDLTTRAEVIFDGPPARQLAIDDLDPRSAESQRHPKAV